MKGSKKILNEARMEPLQVARYKKWDHFDLFGEDYYISGSIADYGLISRIKVLFYDYTNNKSKLFEHNILPIQKPTLSSTSYRFTNST